MNKTLPPEVVEALRTLARIFTEVADAGTVEAFKTFYANKTADAALDKVYSGFTFSLCSTSWE